MRNYQDLTEEDKMQIRERIDILVQSLSSELDACVEAIGNEFYYRVQRHPQYGRNATKSHKDASYTHWKGICQKCKVKPLKRLEAKFHHLERGIPNQHSPQNLVPLHTKCHDKEHNVVHGSLAKGAAEPNQAEPRTGQPPQP